MDVNADAGNGEVTALVSAGPPPPRWVVRGTAVLVPLSVLFAWYRGFRMPNIWSATLEAVSVTDGFHRRILVGTLLRPLALLFDFPYALFATFAFLVLGAVVVTISVLALRTQLVSQRVLVIAWLVCGPGGYLFNEVGYLDQLLYLFLFAAVWCVHRSRLASASVLMVLAVFGHEITLLTVLPIFVFVAWKDLPREKALKVLAAPVLVNLVVVLVPAAGSGAVDGLARTLVDRADFFPRLDALGVFDQSQTGNWDLYSPWDVFRFLLPIAVVMVAAFLVVWYFATRDRAGDAHGWARADVRLLGALAIGAPLLLTAAGWDKYRWGFLILTNFFVVMWIWLGDVRRELDVCQWATVAVALLIVMQCGNLHYLDGYRARELGPEAIADFWTDLTDGTVTTQPDDGEFFNRLPAPESSP